jgi:hypothetical protein
VPVKGSWISLLFLANIGLWLAIYAPLQVLLPEQVQSPHDHITKSNVVPSGTDAVLLSVVIGVGAIVGLIANPVVVAPLAAGVVLGLMSRGSTGIDEQLRCPLALAGLVTVMAAWTVSRVRSVS